MSIAPGEYYIRCAAGDFQVGRMHKEDRSLLPKRVVSLPEDEKPTQPWVAVKNEDGSFILKAGGAPTMDINGELFAVVIDRGGHTDWRVIRAERHGKDAYIVTTNEGYLGWVLPSVAPYQQIAVRPLIVGPSEPPTYPLNQVFIFEAVKKD